MPREEEESVMDNLRSLLAVADHADPEDDLGLDAATLAFINDLGGTVAS